MAISSLRPRSRNYRVTVSSDEAITLFLALQRSNRSTETTLQTWEIGDNSEHNVRRQRVADGLAAGKRLEEKLGRKLLVFRTVPSGRP